MLQPHLDGTGLAIHAALETPYLEKLSMPVVHSATVVGITARPVVVEVSLRGGLPRMTIVGLPDTAVRESKERVISAIIQSRFFLPQDVIIVNLAPADLKKEGAAFDLPIALGILAAADLIPVESLQDTVVLGELSLNGEVRPVRGVLPVALDMSHRGFRRLIVPEANAPEAAVVGRIEVFPVRHLLQAFYFLRGDQALSPFRYEPNPSEGRPPTRLDMADVRGHAYVKRALEVAAAGGHNVIMIGPPGSGKTMLAQRVAAILPPMTREEAIEVTRVHSVAGCLDGQGLVTIRPFRSPHHSISVAGLIGGGTYPRPGEASLAHHGVLFLDEIPEFPRSALEVLRQPMETGVVTIARAATSVTYPARFMLVAAMNPCPCGHYGNPLRACRCSPAQIHRYLQRISGPLLDRIDIQVEVPMLAPEEIDRAPDGEPSARIQERVVRARAVQWRRFRVEGEVAEETSSSVFCNAQMMPAHIDRFCPMSPDARRLVRSAMRQWSLSARAFHRILKVARTIADLEGAETIEARHVAEAIQYRILDRRPE